MANDNTPMKALFRFNGLRCKQEAFYEIIFLFKHSWRFFLTVSLALTKKIDVFLLRNVSPHSVNSFLEVSETHSGNTK